MALIIPWEYLVSGLVVHLVAVILSLPLFFFIPETHEFLHGIFLRIVRTYEILQWCLQLFLLSMKKIICFSCWISRTFLVDSVAIPWYVVAELGSVILRRNRQPGGENPEPCQAFNGYSEEEARDQNRKDLRKDVPHLKEKSGAVQPTTKKKRSMKAKLLQEEKGQLSATRTNSENMGELSRNIESLDNYSTPTTTKPPVDAAVDINPVKNEPDEACAAKPEGEPSNGSHSPCSAKPTVVCNNSVETASSILRSIEYFVDKNFYRCTIDEHGGILKLPFCILIFPAMAVLASKVLKIAVIQKVKQDRRIQVIPAIHCTDSEWCTAVQFHKPLRIEVETTTNWIGGDIEIQVTESSTTLDWQKVDGVEVTRKTDSISFSLNSFAGVRAVVQQPALELYHAVFVKRLDGFPNPTEHLFYILLFSGDRNSQKAASFTLASPANEVVIERQLLVVRPPCAFKALLSIPAISSSSSEVSFEIPANCFRIHKNQMIKIAKGDCSAAIQPGVSVGLNYKVCSFGSSSKQYAFYWSSPVIPRSISISSVNRWWCESERGFRDHELLPLFRDNSALFSVQRSVPNLTDQDTLYADDTHLSKSKRSNAWSTYPDREKELQFQWSVPGQWCPQTSRTSRMRSIVFKASGDGAIGQQNNFSYLDCSPTTTEGIPNLERNQSEPLFGTYPQTVAHVQSVPAKLKTMQSCNQNILFPIDPLYLPNPIPISERSQVENVEICGHSETIPKNICSSSKPMLDALAEISQNETVPKQIAPTTTEGMPNFMQNQSDKHPRAIVSEQSLPAKLKNMQSCNENSLCLIDPVRSSSKSIEKKVSEERTTKIGGLEATLRGITLKEATKMAAICPEGGKIELYESRVSFPINAVMENTDFKVSIDNNPAKYPKDRVPITPILRVEPKVNFNKPVSVWMRTWYSAAKGEKLIAQVMNKEDGGDWEVEKEVVLSDTNEVKFDVWHFCDKCIAVKDSLTGVFHFMNEVYIQRKTATIISAFFKDEKTQNETRQGFLNLEYIQATPRHQIIRGGADSIFELAIDCVKPKKATYHGMGDISQFKISQGVEDNLVQIEFYLKNSEAEKYKGSSFIARHHVTLQGTKNCRDCPYNRHTLLSVPWPIELTTIYDKVRHELSSRKVKTEDHQQPGPSESCGRASMTVDVHGNLVIDNTKNALKMADNGSTFTANEDGGTRNTLNFKPPSNNTSAEGQNENID